MKKRILFVDDEPNILQGLQRMLRMLRQDMDFSFAENGPAALEMLAAQHHDIVVSDMRMPIMDGATLLTTVQDQYPQMMRIMLTGQAEESAVLRTVAVAHQFLAKPVNPDALKCVLSRSCAVQDLLADDQLKSSVARLGTLPSLPAVYAELQEKITDPECAIHEIATIIQKDMAMTAKILQLVNSAFFGLYKNIDSPMRAVTLLGLDTVKALVLGVGVFTEMQATPSKKFSVGSLWDHSIATAACAKKIVYAETSDRHLADTAFIAGMMHDVGKLLFFSSLHDAYTEAVELAIATGCSLDQAEKVTFKTAHGEVGGYLMGLWGLPGEVVEAIAFHHRLENHPEPSFCIALAVHAADTIAHQLQPGKSIGAPPMINTAYLDQAGLAERYPQWLTLCQEMET